MTDEQLKLDQELKKYKNTKDFAKAHGAVNNGGEETSILKSLVDSVKRELEFQSEKWELERSLAFSGPFGIFYEPTASVKAEAELYKKRQELDAQRPTIDSYLTFETLSPAKAEGLRVKFGLFAGTWNKFVDELAAGRVGVAEVLYLDCENIRSSEEEYYVKIAALDGTVLKGPIRRIYYSRTGCSFYREFNVWMDPEEYRDEYGGRSEEEYRLYETVFLANSRLDVVDPTDRPHAYVLHWNVGGKDYYGLVSDSELDNLKELKDSMSLMTPEKSFKPDNNHVCDFIW